MRSPVFDLFIWYYPAAFPYGNFYTQKPPGVISEKYTIYLFNVDTMGMESINRYLESKKRKITKAGDSGYFKNISFTDLILN